MSNETFDDQSAPATEEVDKTSEVIDIDALPEKLGYIETAELSRLKPLLVEVMVSGTRDEVIAAVKQYDALAQQVVDLNQGEAWMRAHLGSDISKALIRRDAGLIQDYLDDLYEAETVALNEGFHDVLDTLQRVIRPAKYSTS
jgi:hypothetical protein